jgi:hypothetical protein
MFDFIGKKNLFPNFSRQDPRKGIALYLAMAGLSIVLAVALGVSLLSVYQLKNVNEAGNSVIAFAAAETGVEWAICPRYAGEYLDDVNYTTMCNKPGSTANYHICADEGLGAAHYIVTAETDVESLSCPPEVVCIKSVGIYRGTQRVIRIQQ